MADRFVSGSVGSSKYGGDGVVHSGAEHEQGVAYDIEVDGAGAKGGGGIYNGCCGVSRRCVINGVDTIKYSGDGVVHSDAEHEEGVACEIDIDVSGAKGGGGIDNACCGVSKRCVINGVGTRQDDGKGVVHGGTDDKDAGTRDINVVGANAKGGLSIGNDCCGLGDRFMSNDVGSSKYVDDGVVHGHAKYEDRVAREINADGGNARSGGGIGNDCPGVVDRLNNDWCSVSDRFVSYGVGISITDGYGVVHSGDRCEDGIAREIDTYGGNARGSGRVGNAFGAVGDRFRERWRRCHQS